MNACLKQMKNRLLLLFILDLVWYYRNQKKVETKINPQGELLDKLSLNILVSSYFFFS